MKMKTGLFFTKKLKRKQKQAYLKCKDNLSILKRKYETF